MNKGMLALALAGAVTLSACANNEERMGPPPPPPMGPGAIPGTVAADRDGDGIVDGYYTAGGEYRPISGPPCPPPPPPPPPSPRGERG